MSVKSGACGPRFTAAAGRATADGPRDRGQRDDVPRTPPDRGQRRCSTPMTPAPPAAAPPGATGRVPSRREYNLQYYRLATFYLCMLAKEKLFFVKI